MTKLSLINFIKYNPLIYKIYFNVGNLAIRILKLFIRHNDRRIFFISFGGRKFDDSPKAIYERLINDSRFDSYELIWAFQNPDKFTIPKGIKIKTDTLKYFCILLSSRVWITNSSVERGLRFTGKKTLYINTWHGSPIKKMGTDMPNDNSSFLGAGDDSNTDIMLAQSNFEVNIFSRVFKIPKERFRLTGLPRNDSLIEDNRPEHIKILKKRLGIDTDKKVILYAPTFREYQRGINNGCMLTPPITPKKWAKALGNEYIFLLRAHYEVARFLIADGGDFMLDVSDYPSLNELMLVSDILISDYSSIFFDYSILCRPMLTFCYDYNEYAEKRGMYFDIREELKNDSKTEDELISKIKYLAYENQSEISRYFKHKYISECGCASQKTLEIIYRNL